LIRSKCEKSTYYLFSSPGDDVKDPFLEVKLPTDNILDNMKILSKEVPRLGGGNDSLVKVLQIIK